MTPELRDRLREGEAPFAGWTISSGELGLAPLRQALLTVATRLRAVSPSRLNEFKDWFFHTEVPSPGVAPSDWAEFDRKLESDDAAIGFCVADTVCSFALFPADYAWLLRVYVPEEADDSEYVTCGFDFTGPLGLVRALTQDLAPLELAFEPSVRFFVPSWEREWKPDVLP